MFTVLCLQLFEVGGKKFLDLEAEAFMKFEAENSVISLTGSQPMNDDAMAHARKLGSFIRAIFVSQPCSEYLLCYFSIL